MPSADFSFKVVNGKNGYVWDNTSWVIGRIVRDYEDWVDMRVDYHLRIMLVEKWEELRKKGVMKKPTQAGLCVFIYRSCQLAYVLIRTLVSLWSCGTVF